MTISSQTISSENQNNSEEINLLDLLIIITSHIKLIIILPLVGAFIGWLLTTPPVAIYQSISTLNVEVLRADEKIPKFRTEVIASLINSNQEFQNLIKDNYLNGNGIVTAVVDHKNRLLKIISNAPTAHDAQRLNERVLEKLYITTTPKGSQADMIKLIISEEKKRLLGVEKTIQELEKQNSLKESSGNKIISDLLNFKLDRELNISKLEIAAQGLTHDDLIQPPSLATEVSIPAVKKYMKLLAGMAIGFFIALLFAFAKHAFQSASSDIKTKEKLKIISNNLGIK